MTIETCPTCGGTGQKKARTREEIEQRIEGFGRRLMESTERSEIRRGRALPEERALVGKIVSAMRSEMLGAAA